MKSRTSTGYFSNSNSSSATNRQFSPDIDFKHHPCLINYASHFYHLPLEVVMAHDQCKANGLIFMPVFIHRRSFFFSYGTPQCHCCYDWTSTFYLHTKIRCPDPLSGLGGVFECTAGLLTLVEVVHLDQLVFGSIWAWIGYGFVLST